MLMRENSYYPVCLLKYRGSNDDAAKSKLFYDNSITKQITWHIFCSARGWVKTSWKLDDGEDYFTPSAILIKLKSLHAIQIRASCHAARDSVSETLSSVCYTNKID